jgi:hypothetical protein
MEKNLTCVIIKYNKFIRWMQKNNIIKKVSVKRRDYNGNDK